MLIDSDSQEWYRDWFNTEYYHVLYGKRSISEAMLFVDNLMSASIVFPGHKVLDLCCGKGRHAVYLSSKGVCTTGIDLSKNNIEFAQQQSHSLLRFIQADMRETHTICEYDFILNLFTSFGYFNHDSDHLKTLHSCFSMLKPGGELWIDFMNSLKVKELLQCEISDQEIKDPYRFEIKKKIDTGFVVKEISVYDLCGNKLLGTFYERVKLFSLHDFENMLQNAGFLINEVYGDYNLQKFNKKTSPRMIIRAKKML